jgi:hypothetical protein
LRTRSWQTQDRETQVRSAATVWFPHAASALRKAPRRLSDIFAVMPRLPIILSLSKDAMPQ